MKIEIESLSPPLRREESGALRVGSSRVLAELVLRAFQDGSTPEAIAQRFPTMTLADAYAVIAYYLGHREDLDAYLAERDEQGESVRRRIESCQGDLADLRERLVARGPKARG